MTLKLHHLRPAPGAKTAKTRVGRGEGSKGKTAGRGTKGTKARYQVPVAFEGGQMPIHMRLPKLKGFKNPFRVEFQVVNLDRLNELFPDGGTVSVEDLVAKGAVRKNQPVKVLGQGDISVAVQVSANAFSSSAKAKIEAAGGTVTRGLRPRSRTSGEGLAAQWELSAGPSSLPGKRPSDRLLGFPGLSSYERRGRLVRPPIRGRAPNERGTSARRVRQRFPDAGPAAQAAVRPADHHDLPARLPGARRRASTSPTSRRASATSRRAASTAWSTCSRVVRCSS